MAELKGLLDSAKRKIGGLLGDFPAGFNSGAVAGVAGYPGDIAYMLDTAGRAITGQDTQPAAQDFPGTTDYIAAKAGYPIPGSFSGQLGAAVGGMLTPGPGDLGRLAPLGAMFLGAKAKTAMLDVLEYAQAMEKAGKSADEIWQTTGKLGQPWFRGADGKWRFEVDDSARFKSEPAKAALADTASGDVIPLSQLLGQEDEIARAYPDIGNVLFERTDAGGGLYYPPNKFGTEKIEVGSRDARSAALHETMHPIQVREGFALGGLPANSSKSAEDDYWRLAAEAEARNVQHRADMSMDERLTLPPWVTQDVPTKQQIVRFGDGPAMAIEDFAARRAGKAKPYREAMGGAPADEALLTAQRNAAKPIADGGLGLSPNNTAAERAAAMGYTIPAYRGSDSVETEAMPGVFWSQDPAYASAYGSVATLEPKNMRKPGVDPRRGWFDKDGNWVDAQQNVMPLLVRPGDEVVTGGEYLTHPYRPATVDPGNVDTVLLPDPYNQGVILEGQSRKPANVRARFAAFDPAKKDSANLLAGLAALGVGTAAVKSQQEKERRNGL